MFHMSRSFRGERPQPVEVSKSSTLLGNRENLRVFPSETGKTPIWANSVWYDHIRPTLSKAGLVWVNYQVLRRSAVTLHNALGADSTIVAAQMVHTVDVGTNVYNKVGIQRPQTAIQKLDNAINPTNRPANGVVAGHAVRRNRHSKAK
jgi:hypothetical protein